MWVKVAAMTKVAGRYSFMVLRTPASVGPTLVSADQSLVWGREEPGLKALHVPDFVWPCHNDKVEGVYLGGP